MGANDIGRKGIDAGTRVKVYLKSDSARGTFCRGRLNHPYSGEGNVEITTATRETTIVPADNVDHITTDNRSD